MSRILPDDHARDRRPSFQSCLVAVVVPDPDYLLKWASQNRIGGTYEELCANKVVKKSILDDLILAGKQNDLKSFELVSIKSRRIGCCQKELPPSLDRSLLRFDRVTFVLR